MGRGYRAEMVEQAGLPACTLHDEAADLHATWLLGAGMLGASLTHRGEQLLWQGAGADGYAAERKFMGIPFLHPWANRLSTFGYRAGGHEVRLDRDNPLLLLDTNGLPIHGVLTASRSWVAERHFAGDDGATLLAALDFDRPELLAAFPFRHRIEMEVRLRGGVLQVGTTLSATGDDPVPVAFGFHPYLRIPGLPRAQWEVSFPVRRRLTLDQQLVPTGASEPVKPLEGPIGERTWDDGFDHIDPPGLFEVRGGGWTIAVYFAEGFPVAQIYAPPGEEYVCIEPMTAPANALNGRDSALTWVRPGERFSATFCIDCQAAD
ncbi:MAG: aldose 1-epimerase [Solirubrobacterales bacterium]|nr:aldose 1-epimerase [Solirubrobacterales bacterium]